MGDYVRYISGLMAVLALMLVISTASGADANYDPVTKRTYDPFGSFFDEYGQYIDIVNNVVMDRHASWCILENLIASLHWMRLKHGHPDLPLNHVPMLWPIVNF